MFEDALSQNAKSVINIIQSNKVVLKIELIKMKGGFSDGRTVDISVTGKETESFEYATSLDWRITQKYDFIKIVHYIVAHCKYDFTNYTMTVNNKPFDIPPDLKKIDKRSFNLVRPIKDGSVKEIFVAPQMIGLPGNFYGIPVYAHPSFVTSTPNSGKPLTSNKDDNYPITALLMHNTPGMRSALRQTSKANYTNSMQTVGPEHILRAIFYKIIFESIRIYSLKEKNKQLFVKGNYEYIHILIKYSTHTVAIIVDFDSEYSYKFSIFNFKKDEYPDVVQAIIFQNYFKKNPNYRSEEDELKFDKLIMEVLKHSGENNLFKSKIYITGLEERMPPRSVDSLESRDYEPIGSFIKTMPKEFKTSLSEALEKQKNIFSLKSKP